MKTEIMHDTIVNVAVPINVNRLFKYHIPDGSDIKDILYKRVLVDFKSRLIQGYAVSRGEHTDEYKIKKIDKIIDTRAVFNDRMIELASWIADYYFAGIGEVLSVMIPKGIRPDKTDEDETGLSPDNTLTQSQQAVYDGITKDISNGINKFYLYGITGSGKTEIYIKLIEQCINSGRNCILLVPEIALSHQTLSKLKSRFGNLCALLHSGLRGSVRLREYLRLFDGKARIAVGPRSALFAPLDNIGLIIIDEENEGSYKSEESPRFHTRTCAQYLAKTHNAALLLGSATPSIESWYHAEKGYFKMYKLGERFQGAALPDISIIKSSEEKMVKNLSMTLIDEVNKRLKNKEQVILLQNRRGFANFIKCKSCGHIFACPKCSISLTFHKPKNSLICHHCGYHTGYPERCPECKSEELLKIGAGTQRIEDEIQDIFKHAKILRMDFDSLKKGRNLSELFDKIENGDIDILVGTQMLAKGLHFPKIKLVGIINADLFLNLPDYKAPERAFSLITQVAGRAGRVGEKGRVFIQTFNPEHYSIVNAKNNDYETFYKTEIDFRKIMDMPPFTRLVRIIIRGRDEEKIKKDIDKAAESINKNNRDKIHVLGPAPCMILKVNNNFRYQILLKSKNIGNIQKLLYESLKEIKVNHKNYLEIDVDPADLF